MRLSILTAMILAMLGLRICTGTTDVPDPWGFPDVVPGTTRHVLDHES